MRGGFASGSRLRIDGCNRNKGYIIYIIAMKDNLSGFEQRSEN